MNKQQLQMKLLKDNISPDSYSLDGGLPNEALCLDTYYGVWEVYYSERGGKSGLKKFDSEEKACDYFYELIQSDWTMR